MFRRSNLPRCADCTGKGPWFLAIAMAPFLSVRAILAQILAAPQVPVVAPAVQAAGALLWGVPASRRVALAQVQELVSLPAQPGRNPPVRAPDQAWLAELRGRAVPAELPAVVAVWQVAAAWQAAAAWQVAAAWQAAVAWQVADLEQPERADPAFEDLPVEQPVELVLAQPGSPTRPPIARDPSG